MHGIFYDIEIGDGVYRYKYILTIRKGLFQREHVWLLFHSKLPHYWFAVIWHMLEVKIKDEGLTWDHITSRTQDIRIGTLDINKFTAQDVRSIDTSKASLSRYLDSTFEKARVYKKEYEKKHGGAPDLDMPYT